MRTVRYRVGWWPRILGEGLEEDADRIVPTAVYGTAIDLLWSRLSVDRLALLRRMAGLDPMTRREAARLVGRSWRTVHRDLAILVEAGLVEETADGRVVCRIARIEIEIDLCDPPDEA